MCLYRPLVQLEFAALMVLNLLEMLRFHYFALHLCILLCRNWLGCITDFHDAKWSLLFTRCIGRVPGRAISPLPARIFSLLPK